MCCPGQLRGGHTRQPRLPAEGTGLLLTRLTNPKGVRLEHAQDSHFSSSEKCEMANANQAGSQSTLIAVYESVKWVSTEGLTALTLGSLEPSKNQKPTPGNRCKIQRRGGGQGHQCSNCCSHFLLHSGSEISRILCELVPGASWALSMICR